MQIIHFKNHQVLAIAGMMAMLFLKYQANAQTITWKLNSISSVGNTTPEVLGQPVVKTADGRIAIAFNGVNDGLIVPHTPTEGWRQFTIEVLFKPDSDGPLAPRFVHFQDADGNRCTFELRLTENKQWYMDTFLKNGKAGDKGTTLIEPTLLHPADRWYWAALVFNGRTMTSYVNGVKELEGASNFTAIGNAPLALGMRLNKVAWFKGQISEVRFHPEVLKQDELQRVVE